MLCFETDCNYVDKVPHLQCVCVCSSFLVPFTHIPVAVFNNKKVPFPTNTQRIRPNIVMMCYTGTHPVQLQNGTQNIWWTQDASVARAACAFHRIRPHITPHSPRDIMSCYVWSMWHVKSLYALRVGRE